VDEIEDVAEQRLGGGGADSQGSGEGFGGERGDSRGAVAAGVFIGSQDSGVALGRVGSGPLKDPFELFDLGQGHHVALLRERGEQGALVELGGGGGFHGSTQPESTDNFARS